MDINGHRSEFRSNAGLITWELRLDGPIPAEAWPALRRLQKVAEETSTKIDAALADLIEDNLNRAAAAQ